MKNPFYSLFLLFFIAILFSVGLKSTSVSAVEISAAQIQAIKNMSPEEQKQFARQLGIDPSQFSGAALSADGQQDDQEAEPDQNNVIAPRSVDDRNNASMRSANSRSNGDKSSSVVDGSDSRGDVNNQDPADSNSSDDNSSAVSDDNTRDAGAVSNQSVQRSNNGQIDDRFDAATKKNAKRSLNDNSSDISIGQRQKNSRNDRNNKDSLNDQNNDIARKDKDKDKDKDKIKLKPFGYDLFAGAPSTFAPAGKIPVPENYVIGPGDTVIIQLYGKENNTYEIKVTREGVLQFPGIGPISVNGLDFGALRDQIKNSVAKQMIGEKVNITMGALRSMQVFVLGEAYKPGAYTVSALSTMTNALLVSGGIKTIGSLRDIQLKRKGKVVTHFDFYDLLLHGDTSDDRRLLPGDVIFIPPVGKTAGISGEVQRPAIYELKGDTSVDQLVKLAGGFLATAYPKIARIERINQSGERTFVDLNLASGVGRSKSLLNGDVVRVSSVSDQLEKAAVVSGYVLRPGGFTWRPGLRVSQVVRSAINLKADPDMDFAWLKRTSDDRRILKLLRVDLGKALARPGGYADIRLQARDEIVVMGRADDHQQAVADIVDDLKLRAAIGQYPKVVAIQGNVRFPGEYPLAENMRLIDLVAAAGNLKAEPDLANVLVASRSPVSGVVSVKRFDLTHAEDQQKHLASSDKIFVFGKHESRKKYLKELITTLQRQATQDQWQQIVRVEGSVRFPGDYPLLPHMAVQDLVELAGGFAEGAYADTAEITRDIVVNGDEHRVIHEEVNLRDPSVKGLAYALQSKDQLVIKQISEWGKVNFVTVEGEFKYPGRYPIAEGETLSQLIKRAGGVTDQGDLDAAVFLRKSLKEKENALLEKMQQRMQEDSKRLEAEAASQAAATPAVAQAKSESAKLLTQIKAAESSGRLIIDVKALASGDKKSDVFLRDGDTIAVPKFVQEVSVLGEVQFPTSHLYKQNTEASDYIRLSGGMTQFSDKKRAYIIHKNGQVEPAAKSILWLFSYESDVKPGDTVVVPVSVEVSSLTYWTSISQVIFQMATTVAALHSVGLYK